MDEAKSLSVEVEQFQNLLISIATGGPRGEEDEFKNLRQALINRKEIAGNLPRFVHTCRDLGQFWQFIKHKFDTYKERRAYVWEEFQPILDHLEGRPHSSTETISAAIERFNAEGIHSAWNKALERRSEDPAGAITAARTLLESVCKHILDDAKVEYADNAELPKLYRQCAEVLNLAPDQHTAGIFQQILGGCTSVVQGLGALRNKVGDAHGAGRNATKPAPRHAQLSVNLAGTMATFLIETWEAKKSRNEAPH